MLQLHHQYTEGKTHNCDYVVAHAVPLHFAVCLPNGIVVSTEEDHNLICFHNVSRICCFFTVCMLKRQQRGVLVDWGRSEPGQRN